MSTNAWLDPNIVTQGSTTLGQSGPLAQAAATAASPTYTEGTTAPLSVDLAGNLRVLGSGGGTTSNVNIAQYGGVATSLGQKVMASSIPITIASDQSALPISGTVTANQGGTWNITNISGTISLPTGAATEATLAKLPLAQASTTSGQSGPLIQGAVTTAAPTYTTAQTSPLSLTTGGALRVDASGSTIPISGTVTANQGTSPWVVGQSTAANLNATVVGTGTFAVQAAQSGTWNITNISGTISLPTGAATEATLAKLTQTQGSTTSGQSGPLILGAVTTAAPSYTTAQSSPLSLTTGGLLRVDASGSTIPISGTVTANQGGAPWSFNQTQVNGVAVSTGNGVAGTGVQRVTIASDNTAFSVNSVQSGAWSVTANAGTNLNTSALALDTSVNGILLAQASTTSGQTGPLIQGAVTTAAPAYTTAKTSPLSLTTAGALRIDGSASTQPISGTVTANQGGTWNITNISGTISLPTGAATEASLAKLTQTQGSTTSGQSGPLILGAVTTAAPAYTTAQSSPLSLTTTGLLRVDGSGSTQPISGTVTANQGGAPWSVNQTQWNGVAISTGNGVVGTGVVRVAIASDNTAFSVNAVQSGTWNIGTLTTITNAVTVAQATAANLNATVVGTGTFAVQAAQSGTWNITNISGTVSLPTGAATAAKQPALGTFGTPSADVISVQGNNATNVDSTALEASHVLKNAAGKLFTVTGYNSKTSSQFIQIFNSTTVPADTTVPAMVFIVAASSNFSLDLGFFGRQFSTGIAIANSSTAATKTVGSADCWFSATLI